MRKFFPVQQEAYSYLAKNNGTGALFMEMRLGKTLVCIRHAQSTECWQNLVVAPVEGLWAWKRELEMEGEKCQVVLGSKKKRIEILSKECQWTLINYEGVRTVEMELKAIAWDTITLDESRRIANPKAKVTKILQSFPPRQAARLVLSGKPAPESPLEYYEQMRFLYGHFMGYRNYWQFRNNLFRELAPHEWVPKPAALERIKRELHSRAFFRSRKEAGIPDKKIYEVRTVKLPPDLRRMYDKIKKEFVAEYEGKEVKFTKWIPVQYLWLHELSSGFLTDVKYWEGKVDALENLLRGELFGEKVVVWFHYNAPMDFVFKRLQSKGMHVSRVSGSETPEQRFESFTDFKKGKLDVLLIQIKCGRTAIDLSDSSTAIYFSNSYSLEDRKQSEDRILNPTKKEPLLYIDLVAEETVEEDILQILKSKDVDSRFYSNKLISKLKERESASVR